MERRPAQSRGEGAEVLLTGATGFLGKVVLYELVRRQRELGVARIHAVVRTRRGAAALERFRSEVLGSPCFAGLDPGWEKRVVPVVGDLSHEGAGLSTATRRQLTERISHVIHCAASVSFDLPLARAAAANVTSALNVLELARACRDVQAMVDVSTAYATPHPGAGLPIPEALPRLPCAAADTYAEIVAGAHAGHDAEAALLATTGHPNTYTFTKCLAEHLLAERRGGLPLTIVRPSIIAGSLRRPLPGWIDSPAAFALFVLMVATGRMRAVIARPEARLDLVPVDLVAERIVEAAFHPSRAARRRDAPPAILHAVAGAERSPTLAQCAERVEAFFESHPLADGAGPAARVRYLGPDGVRYRLWHLAQHVLRRHARPVAEQILRTNRTFAYFTENTFRFQTSARAQESGFAPRAYLDTACHGIYRHLLGGDDTTVCIAARARRRRGGDLRWAVGRARREAADPAASYLVAKLLRHRAEAVSLDGASFRRALQAVPAGAIPVVSTLQWSALDALLPWFLCVALDLGIAPPRPALPSAWLRAPVLGRVLRRLGALALAPEPDRARAQLAAAAGELGRSGGTLQLFARRDLGLLKALQQTGRPAALLPVAVTYDEVPEDRADDARSVPSVARAWRDLAAGRLRFGRIHVACAEPVLLEPTRDTDDAERAVAAQIRSRLVTTTHHLRGFLGQSRLEGVDAAWLAEAIARRGGRVLASTRPEAPVGRGAARRMRAHFRHRFHREAGRLFAGNPAVESHLRVQGDAAAHGADPDAALADPRLRAVLDALFRPLTRETGRVARLLAGWGRTVPLPSAATVASLLPGAMRGDVEEALDGLVACGALAAPSPDRPRLRTWSQGELLAYAERCEGRLPTWPLHPCARPTADAGVSLRAC